MNYMLDQVLVRRAATWMGMIAFSTLVLCATPDASAAPGERLSISITNKFGDVFTNLTVVRVLGDGLLLEHKAGQLKVKFEELPKQVRAKYQGQAADAVKKDEQRAKANAAFLAHQSEAVADDKSASNQQQRSAPGDTADWKIEVPGQDWKIVIMNPGLKAMYTQSSDDEFACRALPGQNGCNLSIFVGKAPTEDSVTNDDVFRYYWSRAVRNPLLERSTVKVERKAKFVKVSYMTVDVQNVNFYFAYKDRWIDVHLSKSPFTEADEKLFADFEERLSWEE